MPDNQTSITISVATRNRLNVLRAQLARLWEVHKVTTDSLISRLLDEAQDIPKWLQKK